MIDGSDTALNTYLSAMFIKPALASVDRLRRDDLITGYSKSVTVCEYYTCWVKE